MFSRSQEDDHLLDAAKAAEQVYLSLLHRIACRIDSGMPPQGINLDALRTAQSVFEKPESALDSLQQIRRMAASIDSFEYAKWRRCARAISAHFAKQETELRRHMARAQEWDEHAEVLLLQNRAAVAALEVVGAMNALRKMQSKILRSVDHLETQMRSGRVVTLPVYVAV